MRSKNSPPQSESVREPHQSAPALEGKREKILPRVLRVSDAESRAKQARKEQGRKENEGKTLYDYIQKLQKITVGRQQKNHSICLTTPLGQKSQQKESVRTTQHYRSPPKHASHTTPLPITSPKPKSTTFSEEYAMQLALKKKKKAELNDYSRRSNDKIVERERLQKQFLHEKALAEESIR